MPIPRGLWNESLVSWWDETEQEEGWWDEDLLDVSGLSPITGTFNKTLSALTLTADADIYIKGTSSQTLALLTLTSEGQLQVNGQVGSNLETLALTSTSALQVKGQTSSTLGTLSITATGVASNPITGVFDITFGALGLTATGTTQRRRTIFPFKDKLKDVQEDYEERKEMKLSQLLAGQLQQALELNNRLMQANQNLTQAVTGIQNSTIVPTKPDMPPEKKAELLKRLEMARQAKSAKKAEKLAKEKQRLDNLKKARKALKRKRNA